MKFNIDHTASVHFHSYVCWFLLKCGDICSQRQRCYCPIKTWTLTLPSDKLIWQQQLLYFISETKIYLPKGITSYIHATETSEPPLNYWRACRDKTVLPGMTTDIDGPVISGAGLLAAQMTSWSHPSGGSSHLQNASKGIIWIYWSHIQNLNGYFIALKI